MLATITTMTTYVNLLLGAVFDIRGFEACHPEPTDKCWDSAWGQNWIRSLFLLTSAAKG